MLSELILNSQIFAAESLLEIDNVHEYMRHNIESLSASLHLELVVSLDIVHEFRINFFYYVVQCLILTGRSPTSPLACSLS